MKKKTINFASIMLVIALLLTAFVGCSKSDGKADDVPQIKEYTIQYSHDGGTETISVKSGDLYSIPIIPQKEGYDFVGLFDSQVGGVQFVDASGSCLSSFTDDKNLILFPRFVGKNYTLFLEYQGAPVTGDRNIDIQYGDMLTDLPMNLSLENKEFVGWFTEPDRQGVQVADKYGFRPNMAKFNNDNYDTSESTIILYAGFKGEEYLVTLYPNSSGTPEEVLVEHGTYVKDIVCDARVDGKAVYSWSKTSGSDEVFDGKITGETVLYAVEYAPVIDFNTDGGEKINPIVQKAGNPISLPTPTRQGYEFVQWEDSYGQKFDMRQMPESSITLEAVWKVLMMFDENEGSSIENISAYPYTTITLPTPQREGYIFAGWYDTDRNKFAESVMTTTPTTLKAGWYKENYETIVVRSEDASKDEWLAKQGETNGPNEQWRSAVDLSKYLPENGGQINIRLSIDMFSDVGVFTAGHFLYDGPLVNDSNLLSSAVFNEVSEIEKKYVYEDTLELKSNSLFLSLYAKCVKGETGRFGWASSKTAIVYFGECTLDIVFVDTAKLIL